jgi:hypothetical protein
MKSIITVPILLLLFLTACAGNTPEPAEPVEAQVEPAEIQPKEPAQPAPTDSPEATDSPVVEADTPAPANQADAADPVVQSQPEEPPTLTPIPAPTEVPVPLVISGQTDEGVFFLGDPNAPLTVIDYSDFL